MLSTMAAAGSSRNRSVVFAGGSERAYNYNGLGYDGVPAEPSARIFAFDLRNNSWVDLGEKPGPSMDHRGLLEANGAFFTIGGMGTERQVMGALSRFTLPASRRSPVKPAPKHGVR